MQGAWQGRHTELFFKANADLCLCKANPILAQGEGRTQALPTPDSQWKAAPPEWFGPTLLMTSGRWQEPQHHQPGSSDPKPTQELWVCLPSFNTQWSAQFTWFPAFPSSGRETIFQLMEADPSQAGHCCCLKHKTHHCRAEWRVRRSQQVPAPVPDTQERRKMSYFLKSIFFQNVHLQLKAEYTLYFINDVGQQGIWKLFCFDDYFFFFLEEEGKELKWKT